MVTRAPPADSESLLLVKVGGFRTASGNQTEEAAISENRRSVTDRTELRDTKTVASIKRKRTKVHTFYRNPQILKGDAGFCSSLDDFVTKRSKIKRCLINFSVSCQHKNLRLASKFILIKRASFDTKYNLIGSNNFNLQC
uniref:Uncharacterized protein n=1 Tax=Photinus pyralis TaxID=7054 RepID=A0A1Y1L1L0_PHOPY